MNRKITRKRGHEEEEDSFIEQLKRLSNAVRVSIPIEELPDMTLAIQVEEMFYQLQEEERELRKLVFDKKNEEMRAKFRTLLESYRLGFCRWYEAYRHAERDANGIPLLIFVPSSLFPPLLFLFFVARFPRTPSQPPTTENLGEI